MRGLFRKIGCRTRLRKLNSCQLGSIKKRSYITPQLEDMDEKNFNANAKYNLAVNKLNTLQSIIPRKKSQITYKDENVLVLMNELLNRTNITQMDIKSLNIIHVSGTKGKGSTCAFVESILRHHGYKTGLFTSPHLVEVRERIKINGKPLPKWNFANYFEEVYTRLDSTKENYSVAFPSYFYFLTIMAFHTFMEENVDVAIMEVGIGGTYDCTNVIKYPSVCGISALGIDHTEILGNTLESIAWHKAGIMKPGIPAFTQIQPGNTLDVLYRKAEDMKTSLNVVPDFSQYNIDHIKLGLAGHHQYANASLALQLAECVMNKNRENKAKAFTVTLNHINGLKNCVWKGRAQVSHFLLAQHFIFNIFNF